MYTYQSFLQDVSEKSQKSIKPLIQKWRISSSWEIEGPHRGMGFEWILEGQVWLCFMISNVFLSIKELQIVESLAFSLITSFLPLSKSWETINTEKGLQVTLPPCLSTVFSTS